MQLVKTRLWPTLARTSRAPAAWCFGAAWLVAVGVLAWRGYGGRALFAPVTLLAILFVCGLTVLLTDDPPPAVLPTASRPRLAVQAVIPIAFGAVVEVIAIEGWVVGPSAVPAAITDSLLELVLPLGALLVLGARWRELGFGPGHRVGRVLALWCVPQLINVAGSAIAARASPGLLLFHFVRNGFQNGPVEEFLWRGALQTRLTLLLGGGWGLALTALAFGLWHAGANARLVTHGDYVGAACLGIAAQAPFGLAFGVIFQRTRNLLAGSVFHMVVDLP